MKLDMMETISEDPINGPTSDQTKERKEQEVGYVNKRPW